MNPFSEAARPEGVDDADAEPEAAEAGEDEAEDDGEDVLEDENEEEEDGT